MSSMAFLRTVGCLALASLLVAGCASRSPEVRYYTLSPVPATGPGDSELAVAVGPAEFPKALDRTQIATRVATHRVRYSEFHRWAGTLQTDFLNTVATNLARLLGTERIVVYPDVSSFPLDYRVTFSVQRFDAAADGVVTLEARWVLTDSTTREALMVRQFSTTQPASGDDYDARAAAHSEALAALSREIATEIRAR